MEEDSTLENEGEEQYNEEEEYGEEQEDEEPQVPADYDPNQEDYGMSQSDFMNQGDFQNGPRGPAPGQGGPMSMNRFMGPGPRGPPGPFGGPPMRGRGGFGPRGPRYESYDMKLRLVCSVVFIVHAVLLSLWLFILKDTEAPPLKYKQKC